MEYLKPLDAQHISDSRCNSTAQKDGRYTRKPSA